MSKQIFAILLGGLAVLLHGCAPLDKDKICDGNFCKEYCDRCVADMKKGEAEGHDYPNHIWESCAHSNKAPCPTYGQNVSTLELHRAGKNRMKRDANLRAVSE